MLQAHQSALLHSTQYGETLQAAHLQEVLLVRLQTLHPVSELDGVALLLSQLVVPEDEDQGISPVWVQPVALHVVDELVCAPHALAGPRAGDTGCDALGHLAQPGRVQSCTRV